VPAAGSIRVVLMRLIPKFAAPTPKTIAELEEISKTEEITEPEAAQNEVQTAPEAPTESD
jgi:hypothetical protein